MPVIISKADGGYNYATTDLACIIDRVERLGCDDLLYVVGTPQSQHFDMVFEVAQQAGFMGVSHNAVHVKFGSVLDSDGKILKSREGEVIKLVDLLRESINRAEQAVAERNPETFAGWIIPDTTSPAPKMAPMTKSDTTSSFFWRADGRRR